MTREEIIREAGKKYATHLTDTDRTDFYGKYEQEMQYNCNEHIAFMAGAEWADKNPKSPWISVEDDLPCNHKELIDREIPIYTLYVVVRLKDGTVDSSRMIKIQNGDWVWPFKVSHWFPIPKLPKE